MKDLIRGAVISVAVAACCFAAFVAAALWAPQDQPTIRRHIVAAIEDGTFNTRFSYGPLGSTIFARHTLDCTLAGMMLAPPVNRLVDAISNRHVAINLSWHDRRAPETSDCQALARALPELGPGYGDVRYISNDRYILGVRVFGRVLLSLMPLDAAARLMRAMAFGLLGALGAIALWKLRSAEPNSASRVLPAGYAVIAALLVLLYGVHYFDATLYFAPPDYTHFVFIVISLLVPLASMRPAGLAFYAASYGSLIAIFESLTGGIPFALAMMPLLLALGSPGDRRAYLGRLFVLWGGFCFAVATCFAIKKALVMTVLGDQDQMLSLLWYRMYGTLPPDTGVELSLTYLLATYRRWAGLLAFGSPNIGSGLVLAALVVFAVETWRATATPARTDPPLLMACWLGAAMLIIWSAVFLNHTAVHPYFMARLLVIPVIGAAVLLTARWLTARPSRREPLIV